GGQRQRVLVARALVQDQPVLLLDEPFTGVDEPSAELLERLLDELAADGRGILIATHDVEQVARWDQVLCLNRRQVAFGPPEVTLTPAVLAETYRAEIGVLGAAAAVALAGRAPEIGRDTAVGIVITTLFGLGVLLALSQASPPGLGQLLFGDLLGVSRSDLVVSAILAALVLGALGVLHRQLLVVGFDRSTARALGAHPLLVDLALLGLVAVTVVIGVQALGNLLVIAIV